MLQREAAPTGGSSSIIHVVYLLSICLMELLLQVFMQPCALVPQILRKLLIWKNQSESVADVPGGLLWCVRYYRDEFWVDVSIGPSWDQNSCWLQKQGWPGFSMLPNQMHLLEHCHVPKHFLHWRISGFGCSHHSRLAHLWAAFDLCELQHILWHVSCMHLPRTTSSQSCFSVLGILVPDVLKCLSSWSSAFSKEHSLCTFPLALTLCAVHLKKYGEYKAFQGFNHNLDKKISVKNRESPCTICYSGTSSEFEWFGTKSGTFRNWKGE